MDALLLMIDEAQSARLGTSIINDRFTDYDDQAMSEWTMRDADGATVVRGTTHARFGADGRLTHMTGFFTPPGEESVLTATSDSRSWDIYQAAWARVSGDQRRTLLSTSVDATAVYSDPAGQHSNHETLAAYIDAIQERSPGIWFRQTLFLEHHGHALSRWERLTPDGAPPVRGASYARFLADGRLAIMSGFPGSEPREG